MCSFGGACSFVIMNFRDLGELWNDSNHYTSHSAQKIHLQFTSKHLVKFDMRKKAPRTNSTCRLSVVMHDLVLSIIKHQISFLIQFVSS